MLKVAPIDNPADTREVSENSWKYWPDADGIPGAKQGGGNKIYKVVSDAEVEAAKLPKRPIVPAPVPPEVQNIQAGLGPDGQPKEKEPVKAEEVKAAPEPVNSKKVEEVKNKGGRPRK